MQHEVPRQLLISKKMFAEARAWAKNGQNGLGAKVACWQHKLSWVKNWNEAWVSKVAWQYDRLELCYVLRVRHRPSQTSTWLLLTRLKVPEMTVWSLRKWQARSESKPCRSLSRLSSAGFVTLNTIAVSFDYAVVKRLCDVNESEATGMIVEFRQALTLTEALDDFFRTFNRGICTWCVSFANNHNQQIGLLWKLRELGGMYCPREYNSGTNAR